MPSIVFPLDSSFTPAPLDSLEAVGRVPDYLKATAGASPEAAARLAKLVRVVVFGGTLPASLKLAMGSQITQQCQARYALAHVQRLAKAVGGSAGKDLRTALAVRYATDLTRDIHGVSDELFNSTKLRFNDAQVVELTMVTCFFNYFSRLTAGLGVAPEPWLASTAPQVPRQYISGLTVARVALASDAELAMSAALLERAKNPASSSLGIAIANSQRAMVRVPDIHEAWMTPPRPAGSPAPPAIVPRTTMLQVSLAVSQANGCRYCVLHQVQGLRRQGVEIGKLLALQKSDAALSADEKAAVDFARKLTKTPGALTEADRVALQKHFPGSAAFEVLHQTCRFAFMNRFTDGLRLPSEDEAVQTYREVYGKDFPLK